MHIAKTAENSKLRMTQDKEMNCVLQILPLYFYTVIELTGDKGYWSDPKNNKKWLPYFGTANIDNMKNLGTLHSLIQPATYLELLGATRVINTDIEIDKMKAIQSFENFCKSIENTVIQNKIKAQEKAWLENPLRKEAEAQIQKDLAQGV